MKTIVDRLGWPLVYLGLVVVLAAMLSYMIQDAELHRQWAIASDQWRTGAADVIARQRDRLTAWPGVLVGAALTALGILVLDVRRRQRDGGIDREIMEQRFEDGRPVGFKPTEPGPE